MSPLLRVIESNTKVAQATIPKHRIRRPFLVSSRPSLRISCITSWRRCRHMPSGAFPSQHDQTIANSCRRNLLRCHHGVATSPLRISERTGGCRCLATCDVRMDWPRCGVHFFFEARELGSDPGRGLRAVRIGAHAVKPTSRTSLWIRLSQLRGSSRPGIGNHRSSTSQLINGVRRAPRQATGGAGRETCGP